MTDDVRQLVEYRLEQARETLAAGRDLLQGGHIRDTINRGYYAMFYAALGLLAAKQLGTSKHSGVIALLGQRFVITGEFPSEIAAYLGRAFDVRLKSDYREFAEPLEEDAREVLAHAEEFLAAARQTWERMKDNP